MDKTNLPLLLLQKREAGANPHGRILHWHNWFCYAKTVSSRRISDGAFYGAHHCPDASSTWFMKTVEQGFNMRNLNSFFIEDHPLSGNLKVPQPNMFCPYTAVIKTAPDSGKRQLRYAGQTRTHKSLKEVMIRANANFKKRGDRY